MAKKITKLVLTVVFLLGILAGCSEKSSQKSNLDYIDPNIGGKGHLLHPVRPVVQIPNQMVRMYPVREDIIDDQISYFPLSLVSHRNGRMFGVLPFIEEMNDDLWRKRQTWDHDLEITRPYYYSTYLIDDEITTEFTTGKKAGFFKFTFPEKANKTLVLRTIGHGSELQITSKNSITGIERFKGMEAYVYGEFNQQGKGKTEELVRKARCEKTSGGGAMIEFENSNNNVLEFKYAISFISIEQAKENLKKEIPEWDFASLQATAEQSWDKLFSRIKVKGGSDAKKRTLFTSLYRTYERMMNINEYGRYYSAYDHKVHTTDRDFYVDDWVWDTYLAHHPLRTLLDPEMESDMLDSYVKMYEQSGWMPQFPIVWGDNPAMHGFHSTITFLDCYRKGIRGFDVEKAYEGMLKNAAEATMLPWKNGPKVELDDFYRKHKFFPSLKKGEKEPYPNDVHGFEKRQSVAIALAHSYDDWALAEMAKELGKNDDYNYYIEESKNYRNHYHPEKKLMWPKDSKGNWIEIDPKFDGGPGGREYYDENNGYTYGWQGQHDIHGLINLRGGREAFTADLDQLFREELGRKKYQFWAKFPDHTGIVGQFSMGNEPSFHIPYLYNYSGAPWKTQKHIRFLLDTWFQDNIFGIPGDEDGGGMTAFVVFSLMGFYPVTPGLPIYNIGSPAFEELSIDLDNGKTFTIIAKGSSKRNKYIQSARLNGKTLDRPWFTNDDIMKGSVIELEMGPYPNKKWGAGEQMAPPSAIN
jgi:predicted alpha-1,2-mannosidase